MPGLAGIVYAESTRKEARVERMLASITYRGLNSTKIWQKGNIELGAHGFKLGYEAKSDYIVLFDGHLYNTAELQQKVGRSEVSSDSIETLIASCFELWQEQFISKLNGSFAIVILDQKKQELLLIRDRIGERPLYWSLKNDNFVFASELKAMLMSDLIPQTPDLEALSYYLSFGFIPQEKSPIQGVYKLQPGHYLRFTKAKNLQIRPYWSYSALLKKKYEHSEPKQFSELIENASALRNCDPQASYGCLLSEPIEPGQVMEDLNDLIWHLDEPLADIETVYWWQLGKATKKAGLSTLFSTTGSVEWLQRHIQEPKLPFGYNLSAWAHLIERKALIPMMARFNFKRTCNMLRSVNTHPWHKAFLKQYMLFSKTPSRLCRSLDPEIFLHRFPALEQLGPSLSSLLYLNLKTELPSRYLLREDRIAAAHGLQLEDPFLDYRVVEYLAAVPDHASASEALSLDKIFRPSAKRSVWPSSAWENNREIKHLFEQLLKGVVVESGLVSSTWLQAQLKKWPKNPAVFKELWGILMLEGWFQLFIERKL